MVIASGQAVERTGTTTVAELAERAARAAIDQLVRPPRELDRLSFVRTLSPASATPASAIARVLGIQASQVETSLRGILRPEAARLWRRGRLWLRCSLLQSTVGDLGDDRPELNW